MQDLSQLVRALKKGVVTITFKKIDTNEIRIMPCTLNQDLMDNIKLAIKNIRPESTSIVVYALDKNAIRDVRVNTIQDWYIGNPDA